MKLSIVQRYTLFGVLFGICFPIISSLILAYENGLPFNVGSLLSVHSITALQWIIDTAPLFLGIFAYLAGRANAQIDHLNQEYNLRSQERNEYLEQLQASGSQMQYAIDRRVVQLRTAAQVAQQAAAYRDLPSLLDRTVNLISEQFGFYHVGVFLNDPVNEYAMLQAANSEGGQSMLARGHRLKIGETGIVGFVAAKGEPRIALDVGQDAVFFNNPDLPTTRSEMALALKAGEQIIGVLDVQSTEETAFDENDIVTLQIIADSLATAIENARLFTETQANLEEIQALNRQYLQSAWQNVISRQGSMGYSYESSALTIHKQAPVAELRKIEVPLKLRDQVIGKLSLEAEPKQEYGVAADEWTAEELALIEAAAGQAALALDNARLLEETQRSFAQERVTANISTKVWAAPDIDAILRTTLEELGSTMQATQGMIKLGSESAESISGENVAI